MRAGRTPIQNFQVLVAPFLGILGVANDTDYSKGFVTVHTKIGMALLLQVGRLSSSITAVFT